MYLVDETGARSAAMCVPAKERISVRELAREILTENLSGGLDAIGQNAQGMYGELPHGMGFVVRNSGSSASSAPTGR